jgi:hypothetical protein
MSWLQVNATGVEAGVGTVDGAALVVGVCDGVTAGLAVGVGVLAHAESPSEPEPIIARTTAARMTPAERERVMATMQNLPGKWCDAASGQSERARARVKRPYQVAQRIADRSRHSLQN